MGSKQQKCFDLFIQNDKKGQTNMKNQHITMPALALRGLVIFPGMILHFDIARDRSINAVEEAIEHNDRRIFLVTQIDEDVDEVAAENLYKTGVVAEIRQTLNTPDGARSLYGKAVRHISGRSVSCFGHHSYACTQRYTECRRKNGFYPHYPHRIQAVQRNVTQNAH